MKIYIGQLPQRAAREDIEAVFGRLGSVHGVVILTDRLSRKSKGMALVDMPKDDEARRAIGQLHGSSVLGSKIVVGEAHPLCVAPRQRPSPERMVVTGRSRRAARSQPAKRPR